MSVSKRNKDRKGNLEKFKKKQKEKFMNDQQNIEIPEIRPRPIWSSTAKIEVSGLEFEAIYNFINSVQGAYGAVQSVMNKNILSGNIQLDFEKLNQDKTAYVEMTEEEKAPHKAQYAAVLEAAKNRLETQEPLETVDSTVFEEPKQEGKIIQM